MHRDAAPVIAAQALLAHGVQDELVLAYVQRTWRLDSTDAHAAVDAANTLAGHDHEIVFVDDGSTDRTAERIESAPNVRVVRFAKNAGQSAAMYAGLQSAKGAIAVLIDGDLQNDPADIARLLAEIESVGRLAALIAVDADANRHHGSGSLLSPLACAKSRHGSLNLIPTAPREN